MATGKMFDITVTGEQELVRNVERVAAALEKLAPDAIERSSAVTVRLMQKLVPMRSGKLRRSIRFQIGREGAAKTSVRQSGVMGKTRVVGYIMAGDETTLVGSKQHRFQRKAGSIGRQWQNARLQEFGTTSMPAHPFFFASWRTTKKEVKAQIAKELRLAFKAAQVAPTRSAAA